MLLAMFSACLFTKPCPPSPPRQLIERNAPGYAIGGLAGGETKDMFWRVVAQCAAGLPPGKPRYVMGIGYPLDVVVCSALGADMYDSVYPTRTARFGVALVDSGGCHGMLLFAVGGPSSMPFAARRCLQCDAMHQKQKLSLYKQSANCAACGALVGCFVTAVATAGVALWPRGGVCSTCVAGMAQQGAAVITAHVLCLCAGLIKIKNAQYAKDMRPIDNSCSCMACQRYTRSYLHHTIKAQGLAAPAILITYHNVAYMQVRSAGWGGGVYSSSKSCGQAVRGLWFCCCVHSAECLLSNASQLIVCLAPVCLAPALVTLGACVVLQGLTRRLRAAIKEQRLPDFVRGYVAGMFPQGDVPQWVVDALDFAGISLEGVAKLKPAHDFYAKVPNIAQVPVQ
jgi:hypothetical protein